MHDTVRWASRRWAAARAALPDDVVDAGIALLVFAASLPTSIHGAHGDHRRVIWAVALAVATSLPLVWRRRAPSTVTALTGLGTIGQSVADLLPDIPYGQLVATYTFAAVAPSLIRLTASCATAVGITISIVLPGEPLVALWYTGAMFATAYALGAGARQRRERIVLLEERNSSERAAAAAAERARIARDMHDVLAHSVGLMVVQAEGGAAILRADPDRAEAAFDAISRAGREALVQLRHALGVLRNDAPGRDAPGRDGLGHDGLGHDAPGRETSSYHGSGHDGQGVREPVAGVEQIPRLVDGARGSGLEAHLVETGVPRRVDAEASVAAYRVVQEALTNAVKHAGARHVEITLDWGDHALVVLICDDGRGTDPHSLSAAGSRYGLVGMRARVENCGGGLEAGPRSDGHGFRVAATLPLQGAADRRAAGSVGGRVERSAGGAVGGAAGGRGVR